MGRGQRGILLVCLSTVALGGFFLLGPSSSGALPDSGFLLRSEADLHSLRSLLKIEAVHSQLASFAPSMVMDRVRTDTVGPWGGEFCLPASDRGATGERIRHHFELGSRGAESSRIYFVDY